MIELPQFRTYTSKRFDPQDGSGQVQDHFRVGHIHYRDDVTGAFVDVDLGLVDQGTFWSMQKASYRLRIAKDFAAPALIQYQHRYEGGTHDVVFEPTSLVWLNGADRNPANAQPLATQQSVQGVLVGANVIRWPNAFGTGKHYEVTIRRSHLLKEVVIDTLSALGTPPGPTWHPVLLSTYAGSALASVKVQNRLGADWDENSLFELDGDYRLVEPSGAQTTIHQAMIRDSLPSDDPREIAIPLFWVRHNNQLWQGKVLTRAIVQAATFPIRVDSTLTAYTGAGDGRVNKVDTTWDAVHDATSGQGPDYTSTTAFVQSQFETPNYSIQRDFLPVDTSAIDDTDTIDAWTLSLWVTATEVDDNDADAFIVPVGPTSQADPTAIVSADFDQCSSVDAPTEVADQIRIEDLTTSAYNVFTGSDLTVISKTGYTLLGLREGHDVNDSAVGATRNKVTFSTSEETSTTQDPKLIVTHSAAGGGGSTHHLRLLTLGVG